MRESQAGPWVRLLGEFVVILAGVLLALTADSWMDLRDDRRTETEHLAALVEEFDQSVIALDAARQFKKKQIADLERLLSNDVGDLPADSIGGWIYDGVYVTSGYVPVLSALRDLDSSGERDLIADPDIRRGLSLLSVRLESTARSYDEYVFYHQTVVDPFIANELPVVGLLAARNGVQVDAAPHPDWSVLDSDRAHGLLVFKLSLAGNYIEILDRLEIQFELLIELISERLTLSGA